jgi:NAD(P)-dependent dehydrogenase (short-subunit alcohol dehydrogenase family)
LSCCPRILRTRAALADRSAIDTDLNAWWLRSNDEARAATAARSPLARVGVPADVTGVVAFLASSDAGWVTGQILDTTGGALLRRREHCKCGRVHETKEETGIGLDPAALRLALSLHAG